MPNTDELIVWLDERIANTVRISLGKTGKDLDGWIDDLFYLRGIKAALHEAKLEQADNENLRLWRRSAVAFQVQLREENDQLRARVRELEERHG